MILLSFALAAAAAPPPLTAEQAARIRCVAVLAIVAAAQERGMAGSQVLPPLSRRGARFAQVVGEGIIGETGRTQEQVRDLIVVEAATLRKPGAALPVEEARGCIARMNALVPQPDAVQCAALVQLAADDAKSRENTAKATLLSGLAAKLDAQARSELAAAGKSAADADRAVALARETISQNPSGAPDIEDCMELAKP